LIDGLNGNAVHVVIFACNTPIATARVIMFDSKRKQYRIGLVAVDQSRRGQHLGEKVMRVAMDYIGGAWRRKYFFDSAKAGCWIL